jgi:hypothetical protein
MEGYVFTQLLGFPSRQDVMNGKATKEEYIMTQEAVAGATAMIHSLTLVPSLFVLLLTRHPRLASTTTTTTTTTSPLISYWRSYPAATWETTASFGPIWWNPTALALLQFCTGYMIYDAICSILYYKWIQHNTSLSASDLMFLGHHIATALYMSSTRYIGAGHISALICMFLGECTNPFHNGYDILHRAMQLSCCRDARIYQLLYHLDTICFCLLYIVIRAFLGPIILSYVTYDIWKHGTQCHIPLFWRILWSLLIWGVVFGSIPWITECYHMLLPFLRHTHFGISTTSTATNEEEL